MPGAPPTPDRILSLRPSSSSASLPLSVPLHPFRPREQEARQSGKMSDQEDLDYYIMFPSFPPSPKDPTLTATGQDQREEFVFVYEEDKRPVVILLGWAGCQDRYLAKYSSIYEEKRYSGQLISRESDTAIRSSWHAFNFWEIGNSHVENNTILRFSSRSKSFACAPGAHFINGVESARTILRKNNTQMSLTRHSATKSSCDPILDDL